jgi:hypothetical protein
MFELPDDPDYYDLLRLRRERKLQRANDRSIKRAASRQGWMNWHLNRGRLYGSGAILRKAMRQISWRRA